jgi:uncharacterized membrane protein YjgN (DUF898 family)
MSTHTYQVIYKGEILAGFDKETVFRNVADIMAISAESAIEIVSSSRMVLKKGLDEATARSQCILLKKAGLRVALGAPPPSSTADISGALPPVQAKTPVFSKAPTPMDAAVAPVASFKVQTTANERSRPSSSAASVPIPFEFSGGGSEYFRIWLVNILLSVLTLGVYSAWAKVRNKQYLYGNTRLHGDGFEYLASPMQILKGRALVGGVLAAYWGLSMFLPYVEALFALAFACAFPWLMVRALAFNAHHTAWRHIRFGFSAGYREAFNVFILWPVLTILTLGLLSPYVFYRQKKFLVENSSFGRNRFSFHATWKDYYRMMMGASLLALLAVAIVVVAAFTFAPLMVMALPVYLYVFAYFSVKSGNLLYNSSRLGRHRLEASMEVKGYLMLVLTNTLATAATLGLFHPYARVRSLRYKARHLSLLAAGDLDAFAAGRQSAVSAVGDASSDFFDFDLGL